MQEPNRNPSKLSLSPEGKDLVEIFQWLNFGTVLDLTVCDGQPVLDPLPRIIREVKFGSENGPRPELDLEDFALKVQVIELFAQLKAICNGVIKTIEVKNGLPFRMTFEEEAA